MSKSCEIKEYIKKLTDDPKIQEDLNNEHNAIFERLDESGYFKLYDGKLWERNLTRGYVDKINAGRKLVNDINTQYGYKVVDWSKTGISQKRYLYVNVKNVLYSSAITPTKQLTMFSLAPNKVNYAFRAINNVEKNITKVNQWFKQLGNTDKFWTKVQQDLQIPKEQINLLKELANPNTARISKGYSDNFIEQLLLDFSANYSYTVEINTAKGKLKPIVKQENITKEIFDSIEVEPEFDGDPESYSYIKETPEAIYYATFNSEGEEYYTKSIKGEQNKNSSYYSNLSAPGGIGRNKYEGNPDWEYQELEVSTPLITPSIKGHAKFATDKGIGWARVWYNKKTGVVEIQEIQSDLFQKGREVKSPDEIIQELQKSGKLQIKCN